MAVKECYQIAAMPVRRRDDGTIEVLLVTSRTTRRWIIPKGWPMKGRRDFKAASIEAHEEAGLKGRMLRHSIGDYTYWRRTRVDFRLTRVAVYLMRVDRELKRWKEKGQRQQGWLPASDAALIVQEPELSSLILSLATNEKVVAFLAK